MKLSDFLNANNYSITNVLFERVTTNPISPLEGRYVYDDTLKRMKYWNGIEWIVVDSGAAQPITLTGEITGSGTGTINTIASSTLVTNQPETTNLQANSAFLFFDSVGNDLTKLKWSTVSSWVMQNIDANIQSYTLDATSISGGSRLDLIGSGGVTDSVPIIGTTNEVEVSVNTGSIVIGLPNSITVSSINVTNLTINGTPYTPYVHPTQSSITIDGSGLQFVQDISVNTLGHVTAASLGTIPSATTLSAGVMRFATNAEITAGTAGVAVQASQIPLAGSISGTIGYIPVFTGTGAIGNSIVRQNGSTVGVGLLPNTAGDKLQVSGITSTTGVRTTEDDPNKLLASNATVVKPEGDIIILSGELLLKPLNLIASGDYTIPSSKNSLVYVTYDNVGSNTITLPSVGHTGQRIYIMNVNDSAGTSSIVYGATSVEIEIHMCCVLYYNGTNWIMTGKTTLVNFA